MSRLLFRFLLAVGVILIILAAAAWALVSHPPELLRVGAAYAAKTVCSNVFIAGRDAAAVMADDVQAPGDPMLKNLQVKVDQQRKVVRADFFGVIGAGVAVYRPGTGCAAVPDGDAAQASLYNYVPIKVWSPSPSVPWPTGSMVETVSAVQGLVNQDALAGPGMRGIAVIYRGRLIAQRYGQGFGLRSPLLGWSMTKTVNAALVGIQLAEGRLTPQQSGFWPEGADGRSKIALSQLMAMNSGLHFDETYGGVSDLTRMLYLEPDMAAYAAAQPLAQPAGGANSDVWNDSSGTALLLSRIWQRAAAGARTGAEAGANTGPGTGSNAGTNAGASTGANAGPSAGASAAPIAGASASASAGAAVKAPAIGIGAVASAGARPGPAGATSVAVLSLPHDRLFAPMGMSSALIEADARGNLVGSSYMYASTHDWARFGQFLLQDGVWQGKHILPEGFVAAMRQPVSAAAGRYGQGQVWLRGPQGAAPAGQNADLPFNLPADTYWMLGHDGQSIAIVPSKDLVVVRLGLTPDRLQYQPQALLAAVIKALGTAPAD